VDVNDVPVPVAGGDSGHFRDGRRFDEAEHVARKKARARLQRARVRACCRRGRRGSVRGRGGRLDGGLRRGDVLDGSAAGLRREQTAQRRSSPFRPASRPLTSRSLLQAAVQ
jgi:hypothetical protein